MERKRHTVNEWFYSDRWCFQGRGESELTKLVIASRFRNHIAPYIGDEYLDNVPAERLRELCRQMTGQYKYGTIFGVYGVLTLIFGSAVDAGVLGEEQYPCVGLSKYVHSLEYVM